MSCDIKAAPEARWKPPATAVVPRAALESGDKKKKTCRSYKFPPHKTTPTWISICSDKHWLLNSPSKRDMMRHKLSQSLRNSNMLIHTFWHNVFWMFTDFNHHLSLPDKNPIQLWSTDLIWSCKHKQILFQPHYNKLCFPVSSQGPLACRLCITPAKCMELVSTGAWSETPSLPNRIC